MCVCAYVCVLVCVCVDVMLMVSWERMNYLRLKLDCSQTPVAEAGQLNLVWRGGANKHAPLLAHFKPQQGYFITVYMSRKLPRRSHTYPTNSHSKMHHAPM